MKLDISLIENRPSADTVGSPNLRDRFLTDVVALYRPALLMIGDRCQDVQEIAQR